MKIVIQSLVIILSTSIVFVIVNTDASEFIGQILAGIIIVWMSIMAIRKLRGSKELFSGSNFDIFVITLGILLVIFLTGGLSSQIFFLLYFLLFGITFMFEPVTIFVFLASVLLLFGQQLLVEFQFSQALTLGSIVLLSPLSFFFGNEFKKREKILEGNAQTSIQGEAQNNEKAQDVNQTREKSHKASTVKHEGKD